MNVCGGSDLENVTELALDDFAGDFGGQVLGGLGDDASLIVEAYAALGVGESMPWQDCIFRNDVVILITLLCRF